MLLVDREDRKCDGRTFINEAHLNYCLQLLRLLWTQTGETQSNTIVEHQESLVGLCRSHIGNEIPNVKSLRQIILIEDVDVLARHNQLTTVPL